MSRDTRETVVVHSAADLAVKIAFERLCQKDGPVKMKETTKAVLLKTPETLKTMTTTPTNESKR